MRRKPFLAGLPGRVLAASAVAIGLAGAMSTAASAHGHHHGGTFYVSTTGSGTSCTKTAPCQSITQALATANAGSTIKVAAGTYTEQVSVPNSDNGVKIEGAGANRTIVQPPSTGLTSVSDPDDSFPQFFTIDVEPDTTGVTISGLEVNGTNAIPFYDTDTFACGQDPVGIYFDSASGTISNVDVTGIDLPSDLAGCQGGQGIYVASSEGAPSSVSVSKVTLVNPHGASFSGPSYPAFDKNGIACIDVESTCSISKSTVEGAGPTNVIGQNGILTWGSKGTVSGNKVSNVTYTGGGNGNQASGILALNDAALNITGNKVSNSDEDIYAGVVPAFGLMPASIGTWTIEGNTTSKATNETFGGGRFYGEGIEIDSTSNIVLVENNVADSNDIGINLLGVSNATVSGNTASSNVIAGIYVGAPGSAVNDSTDNTISGNTFDNNFYGALVDGQYDPKLGGFGTNPGAATGNTFGGNTWTGNHIQAIDYSGSSGSSPAPLANTWGSPTADSCEPTAGGSPVAGGPYYAC
jgi:parallel beta-helix repeat protein